MRIKVCLVARNRTKEKCSKSKQERWSQSRPQTQVSTALPGISCRTPVRYSSGGSKPPFPQPLSQHHHMTSESEASDKHSANTISQTISSPFRVPTSDGGQWNPKLICYHMPQVTDSNSLQKLALVIMSGPPFPMCTHHAGPAKFWLSRQRWSESLVSHFRCRPFHNHWRFLHNSRQGLAAWASSSS